MKKIIVVSFMKPQLDTRISMWCAFIARSVVAILGVLTRQSAMMKAVG